MGSLINVHAPATIEVPALIVGAGPAGASLACFLSEPPYSLKGMMISAAATTSQTPRAHIVNPAALECLRDIGLEEVCLRNGTSGDSMVHTRWCHDMTGEEYARVYSWGNDPKRKGDYEDATPCRHIDLPQTVFEPIVVERAVAQGWHVRFSTSFERFEQHADGTISSYLVDNLTKASFVVKSKYLFGCDGARSTVLRQLGVPLNKKPGQGLALNVLVDVDLSEYIEARKGNLHWVFQPEKPYPNFAWSGLIRMIKPWHQWMFILFPQDAATFQMPTDEQLLERCRDIVGRDDLPIKLIDVSKWYINEIVAEYYSEGNIFCLGDAVHRHPPFNGLGSNTCIQDAFNLAWKIKLVERGAAHPSLLETYSPERQPVGHGVVTRANQGIRDHMPVWRELGLLGTTPEARVASLAELSTATPEARARRERLNAAIEATSHEFHALGIEMNHRYVSAANGPAGPEPPAWPEDPILHHRSSTFPGSRLPHAWVNRRLPEKEHRSTLDLAGHGVFCLLTGIGGDTWKAAAAVVGEELGIEIKAYSIGWGQDYEDVYRDWERKREVSEGGCVLVRPDRYVCWRAMDTAEECEDKLRVAMRKVLGKM
ncbi:2,4-dichlorophenol 6-monooxygenase [Xylariales sp. PMI_506]|nr:2,4-dichlorophenol 6-monooxygenase [Xylariales sp. PMI_506]